MYSEQKYDSTLKFWMENDYFDELSRRELAEITDLKELEDRFYTTLEFGTGGIRGVLGAGTNRLNRYVIRKVTQGLADTILEHGPEACQRGVVIAYDSRYFSEDFAMEAALVLAVNQIKVYLFEGLRPTPELSFAVRYLQTIAGVNITASHNPKEYNGYKVYWEDGGQLPPAPAKQIITKMAEREDWRIVPADRTRALEEGKVQMIGDQVDAAYQAEIFHSLLNTELTQTYGTKLNIVCTPLHGTGGSPVQSILTKMGFTAFRMVAEQEQPDPEFPTVKSPNPEDPESFALALTLAKKTQADLVLATDPDADRLGAYALDRNGQYCRFTGNQIGVILAYYILDQRRRNHRLPDNGVIVKTIASTDLAEAVAADFGVKTVNVLVGFKYIGEKIKEMEAQCWGTFLFGFEESHGYLAGTYTRDKDAVQASALLAEAALYYKQIENKTLPDILAELFARYGTFLDEQVAFALSGKEGRERIAAVMDRLRTAKPLSVAGLSIRFIDDYQQNIRWDALENKTEEIDLPRENALRFSFEGGGYVMARPSGTEPKIRFYFCIKGSTRAEADATLARVKAEVFALINDLMV